MNAAVDRTMPDFCNRRFPFHFTTALMTLHTRGVDTDRIELLAAGVHENYKGEIWEQEPKPGTELTSETRIVLKVGFPSAVDFVPYQFFYGMQGITNRSGDWETRARKLMASFDAAVVRRMAVTEYQAIKYNLGMIDIDHLTRVLGLFDFDLENNAEDLNEALLWTSLFPTFHIWAGNANRVSEILECILGYRVKIIENIESTFDIPNKLCYKLGNQSDRLGQGTILGKSFTDCDSCYEVVIKGVRTDELDLYLPGAKQHKKLSDILDFCMPGGLEYRIKVEPEIKACVLGDHPQKAFLGYTTHV